MRERCPREYLVAKQAVNARVLREELLRICESQEGQDVWVFGSNAQSGEQ